MYVCVCKGKLMVWSNLLSSVGEICGWSVLGEGEQEGHSWKVRVTLPSINNYTYKNLTKLLNLNLFYISYRFILYENININRSE